MNPALEARALAVGYADRAVLEGVTFQVLPGERWAILGPNGAGKSTLLRTLAGLQPALSGEVHVEGRALSSWPRRELARTLAWVPQQPEPPEGLTGLELVLMGRAPHLGLLGLAGEGDAQRATALLDSLGIAHLAGRAVGTLSGGELRLLTVARGLLQAGSLLLLDEPTAFLDLRHQLEALVRLNAPQLSGLATVTVLHDVNLARAHATHALLVGKGRMLAAGPVAQVLEVEALGALYGVVLERALTDGGREVFWPSRLR